MLTFTDEELMVLSGALALLKKSTEDPYIFAQARALGLWPQCFTLPDNANEDATELHRLIISYLDGKYGPKL